jgi:hypothetical protein
LEIFRTETYPPRIIRRARRPVFLRELMDGMVPDDRVLGMNSLS